MIVPEGKGGGGEGTVFLGVPEYVRHELGYLFDTLPEEHQQLLHTRGVGKMCRVPGKCDGEWSEGIVHMFRKVEVKTKSH